MTSHNTKMEQKDKIIEDLKRQLKPSKDPTSSIERVEMQQKENDALKYNHINANVSEVTPVVVEDSQVAILTKALLEKQALLEAVTAEKNTLALKFETFEVYISLFL